MRMRKIVKFAARYVSDADYRFCFHNQFGIYRKMPDDEFLSKLFYHRMGKKLNLNNPTSFNEKLQWLKLYDRNPIYTTMVDKHLVKQYVSDIVGEEYITPTIGVWERAEDIDFCKLPPKYVLKCNHNSGLGMYICKDNRTLSKKTIKKVRAGLEKGLKQDYYLTLREWPYRDVPRKILVEEYLEVSGDDLPDYKFHCFNGKVRLILVCCDRFSRGGMTEDFFDENWNHLDVHRPNMKFSSRELKAPENLGKMIELAEKLSKDIPFVRVDFYDVDGKIRFGELTFFPASGLGQFIPEEWDRILGSYLRLPGKQL